MHRGVEPRISGVGIQADALTATQLGVLGKHAVLVPWSKSSSIVIPIRASSRDRDCDRKLAGCAFQLMIGARSEPVTVTEGALTVNPEQMTPTTTISRSQSLPGREAWHCRLCGVTCPAFVPSAELPLS